MFVEHEVPEPIDTTVTVDCLCLGDLFAYKGEAYMVISGERVTNPKSMKGEWVPAVNLTQGTIRRLPVKDSVRVQPLDGKLMTRDQ